MRSFQSKVDQTDQTDKRCSSFKIQTNTTFFSFQNTSEKKKTIDRNVSVHVSVHNTSSDKWTQQQID